MLHLSGGSTYIPVEHRSGATQERESTCNRDKLLRRWDRVCPLQHRALGGWSLSFLRGDKVVATSPGMQPLSTTTATVIDQPTANDGAKGLVEEAGAQQPVADVPNTVIRWGPGEMGRGCCWTLFTCPLRASQASSISSISEEERDFAHFCNVSYSKPGDRPAELRGYELLQGEMPLRGGADESGSTTEPLNGERWMVYRHPNKINHALVFRGTVDQLDMKYDAHLLTKGLADHRLMMDSAAFALRAMIFLEERAKAERDAAAGGASSSDPNGNCLKFWVTGHSLGGSTAMGVMLLLNDVPAMAKTLEENAKQYKARHKFLEAYREQIVEVYDAAVAERGTGRPFDLVGGDVFNPGSTPRCLLLSNPCVVLFGCLSFPAFVVSRASLFCYRWCKQGRQRGPRADKLVNNHHVIGDTISMTFRMGNEKSYWPNHWKLHAIAQFL